MEGQSLPFVFFGDGKEKKGGEVYRLTFMEETS